MRETEIGDETVSLVCVPSCLYLSQPFTIDQGEVIFRV